MSTASSMDTVLDPSRNPSNIDPDELFGRHTVSEVRKVQQRLRCVLRLNQAVADCVRVSCPGHRVNAEGKQEELRLMVGYVHNYVCVVYSSSIP